MRRRSPENKAIRSHVYRALAVLGALLSGGILGYRFIEGWPLLDATYMTVTTLATVGFGEVHPLSDAGRAFTMLLILVGVGNIAYALGTATEFFAAGGLGAYRRRSRMERKLESMRDHTIVCGHGRVGSAVATALREAGAPFCVVEQDHHVLSRLAHDEIAFVAGDAGDDETLKRAGIAHARALVAALNDDASNVFLTLTARVLNPAVVIYGKADDPTSLTKLERAGANHRFSPAQVAGHRVANQILRPTLTDIVGLSTKRGEYELAIEEFQALTMPGIVGLPLSATPLWGNPEAMVLAIKTMDGGVLFPPRADHCLRDADRIVIMGKADALARLIAAAS